MFETGSAMKVVDILNQSESTQFSIEVIPPLKGESIESIYSAIDPLMEFNPISINVTYHREEYEYKKMPDGLLKRYSVRKRPGTVGIAAALKYRYKVEPVPHLICGGFSREETENALIDLNYLDIKNVLALRGDSVKNEKYFVPEPEGNSYALELIRQIVQLNNGQYLNEDQKNASPSDFCIGVAGYPEKHFESPNLEYDMDILKQKVDAGADYIVTQLFFDNAKFFEFEQRCRDYGITVPIIPGIKLVATKKHLKLLPSMFHATLPEDLTREVLKCKDNAAVRELGIEWAVAQCRELKERGVPCLHFYTMGRSYGTRRVAEAIF